MLTRDSISISWTAAVVTTWMFLVGVAHSAGDDGTSATNPDSLSATRSQSYWTPERMRNAQPLPEPQIDFEAEQMPPGSRLDRQSEVPQGGAASSPGRRSRHPESERLSDTEPVSPGETIDPTEDEPRSVGTSGCQFSSSRVVPQAADLQYPYRAVGKLFFKKPDGTDWVCSAAVLRPRVVLTAGHCVHSGGTAGFYNNFRFCPAYRNGESKYGCWDWEYVKTTPEWVSSGNVFPNAADYAMLEMRDQLYSGVTSKIGDVVGWFGYLTASLSANHIHMLGFPKGLDSGNRIHQVAAGRCAYGGNNTERYGSDMGGGSSGGPWVQDLGAKANGQSYSSIHGGNLIVGVSSYGSLTSGPKYAGSSIPDSRFITVLDNVCIHRLGNCP